MISNRTLHARYARPGVAWHPRGLGGSWGWEHLVETVNDPTADKHEDIRDWLGLEPGERVDPKAFDLNVPNGRLRRLFR